MKIKKQKKQIRLLFVALLNEMTFMDRLKFIFKKNYFYKPLEKVIEKLRVDSDVNSLVKRLNINQQN